MQRECRGWGVTAPHPMVYGHCNPSLEGFHNADCRAQRTFPGAGLGWNELPRPRKGCNRATVCSPLWPSTALDPATTATHSYTTLNFPRPSGTKEVDAYALAHNPPFGDMLPEWSGLSEP